VISGDESMEICGCAYDSVKVEYVPTHVSTKSAWTILAAVEFTLN
jgi:hypothetical protein